MRLTLLAAAVIAALLAVGGSRAERAPSVELVDGTLVLENSREGHSVFSAENIAPGDSASGTVTVTNGGTLWSALSLSQSTPAPGDEALAAQLQLTIEDVTATPVTVYSGPLTGLDSLALANLGPSVARVYRFTASLPAGADNSVAAASTSVDYTWTATETDPPAPPPGGPTPPPAEGPALREPLRLRVRVPAGQPVAARGWLAAYVRCNQTCSIAGRADLGAVRGRLLRTRTVRIRRLRPGRTARLSLWLPTRDYVALTLSRHRPKAARVRITGRSLAGSSRTVTKRVRLAKR